MPVVGRTFGDILSGVWRPRVIFRFGVKVCLELVVIWDRDFGNVNTGSPFFTIWA